MTEVEKFQNLMDQFGKIQEQIQEMKGRKKEVLKRRQEIFAQVGCSSLEEFDKIYEASQQKANVVAKELQDYVVETTKKLDEANLKWNLY